MKAIPDQSIVITGIGCVLPGCVNADQFWQRLLAGDSAISPYKNPHIASELISHFGHITSEQSAAAAEAVPFKLRRYGSPCSQWGVKAASDALAHAHLDLKQMPDDRCGLFTAQGDYLFPSMPSFARGVSKAIETESLNLAKLTDEFLNHRGMDPFLAIKGLANNMLAIASLTFETRGDCGAFVQNKSAMMAALRSAVFSLRYGYSDVALLICAGSYNEILTLTEMHQRGYLSACNSGGASLRPFDERRDGTIAGEGAVAFVLEKAGHARLRKAVALAEIGGIGNLVEKPERSPRIDAYKRCTQKALDNTGLRFADIDAIVVRGNGGYAQDQHEAALLTVLQKDHMERPITCATPITGSAPACPTDWLTAIGMLKHGKVPPIAHLEQPIDPDLQLVYGKPLLHASRHVLSVNVGYTGFHSAVIFSQP